MSKLDELLAETDKEIIDYGAVTLTPREYDLLCTALRERDVVSPEKIWAAFDAEIRKEFNLPKQGGINFLGGAEHYREVFMRTMLAAAEGK